MSQKTPRPTCPDCESRKLACPSCDDNRPTAEEIHAGWRIRSPFGRWETVERVQHDNQYAPVLIWTKESGPHQSWRYPSWRKLDATRPELTFNGTPEVRVFEYEWREGPMYAFATMDTIVPDIVSGDGILVSARPLGPGKGWEVAHRPDGGDQVVIACNGKAKARSELRWLARQYAKKLGVKLTLPTKGT